MEETAKAACLSHAESELGAAFVLAVGLIGSRPYCRVRSALQEAPLLLRRLVLVDRPGHLLPFLLALFVLYDQRRAEIMILLGLVALLRLWNQQLLILLGKGPDRVAGGLRSR